MQTPITITIESASFIETTLSIFRNALLYLLLLTMECRERERDKAGADMRVGSSKPHWVLLATLHFITSTNHGLQGKREKIEKGRAKIARPF